MSAHANMLSEEHQALIDYMGLGLGSLGIDPERAKRVHSSVLKWLSYHTTEQRRSFPLALRLMAIRHFISHVTDNAKKNNNIIIDEGKNVTINESLYPNEIPLMVEFNKSLSYTSRFTQSISELTADVAEQVSSVLGVDFHNFEIMDEDTKFLCAEVHSQIFVQLAQKRYGLELNVPPIIKYDFGSNTLAAAIKHEKEESKYPHIIAISPEMFKVDMATFLETVHHESIHDFLNQIYIYHDKNIDHHEFGFDFTISKIRREAQGSIGLFPSLYAHDYEERVCYRAEFEFLDKMRRFRPSHQITYRPS